MDLGLIDKTVLDKQVALGACRGEISHILEGHFTALSLIAHFYTLMLQRKMLDRMHSIIVTFKRSHDISETEIERTTKTIKYPKQKNKLNERKNYFNTCRLYRSI